MNTGAALTQVSCGTVFCEVAIVAQSIREHLPTSRIDSVRSRRFIVDQESLGSKSMTLTVSPECSQRPCAFMLAFLKVTPHEAIFAVELMTAKMRGSVLATPRHRTQDLLAFDPACPVQH